MGLNPFHQNPAGIKVALPRTWQQLEGKVEGQVNDDGTVNFYFDTEHRLYGFGETTVHVSGMDRSPGPVD